jgi:GNAT superfamily N-acetyltransferase
MSSPGTAIQKSGVGISTRPVVFEDEDFLYKLYASTREAEFAMMAITDEQRAGLMRGQFELQKKGYASQYPNSVHNVIEVDGQPAGRIWINEDEEEILVVDLALLPEFQRKGIGSYLMRQSMERAAHMGKPVRGTVLWFNVASLEFVRMLGFVGTRADDIFVGVEWRSNPE